VTATVPLRPVRRWIRHAQSAHRDRGETLSTVYVGVLFAVVSGAVLHEQLNALFWPERPALTGAQAIALVVLCGALLLMALRRLGPVSVSRPAASFLLTAPVSRRRLLLPSVRLAAVAAALTAAAACFAVLGHTGSRDSAPVPPLLVVAALTGVALFLIAAAAQSDHRRATLVDRLTAAALTLALA
jgi:hypothetical protein